ncbi:MAG TPA: tripartite tricarboxylate transporter substrate-binding protein, partial [Burkholderiales bacterium]|nr:tripartite tricarboxylate transporter substrate-binding protein [Burkholderiales bacterium]
LPALIVVHPSVPARSVKEMIALAKAKPGQILFGSAGLGTQPHLSMELFAAMAHIRMVHVPYKGTTPGLIDLLGGQLAIMAANMLQTVPYVRGGRLRALGVTTASRVVGAPDIPTIAEGGLPGYDSVQWFGLLAPSGTPREIIARLHKETIAILNLAENTSRLAADGADVTTSTPEAFGAFIQAENAKWARVVKEAGIKPE